MFLTSCGTKAISSKEAFNKYFEINVEACMKPFRSQGIDSINARKICSCSLLKLYEIDSTVFLKSEKEFSEFAKANRRLTESCISDSLLQLINTPIDTQN